MFEIITKFFGGRKEEEVITGPAEQVSHTDNVVANQPQRNDQMTTSEEAPRLGIRGGGEEGEICCGLCAGLLCFECCKDCC